MDEKLIEEQIKAVNATMSLEGMPLTDFDLELLRKVAKGELTTEEAISLAEKEYGF